MFVRALAVAAVAMLFALPACGKDRGPASDTAYYDWVLSRLKSPGIPLKDVDFGRFRRSFVLKYGERSVPAATFEGFNKAMAEGKCEDAVRVSDTILATDFTDINAHIYVADCHRQLGHADLQNFHMAFGTGLVRSIVAGRDGRSTAKAFTVCRPSEEYAVMGYLGLSSATQQLRDNGKRVYDVLVCKDKQGNEVKLYFDVTERMKRVGPQEE